MSARECVTFHQHQASQASLGQEEPQTKESGSEEYGERGTDLFGSGFLEKASKRLEGEKTLSKVTKPPPQNTRRGRYENDKSDLRSFFYPIEEVGVSTVHMGGESVRVPVSPL